MRFGRLAILLLFLAGVSCSHAGRGATAAPPNAADLATAAWAAWERGDIDAARQTATRLQSEPGQRPTADHLLAFVAFVTGDYPQAIALAERVPAGYPRRGELDKLTVQALRHLGRLGEAARFAAERQMDPWSARELKHYADHPMTVASSGLEVIPFADYPARAYMPAVNARINGQTGLALFDTGGTFLIVTPAVAHKLGIALDCGGKGMVGIGHETELCFGVADLEFGGIAIRNIPVTTTTTASGKDLVIFGTNVVQQFLWTADYPNQRFIASPLGDEKLAAAHRAMLPAGGASVPFLMWGDHYMVARGSLGPHAPLNFFVDSGLVYLYKEGDGPIRQAAIEIERSNLGRWQLDPVAQARGRMAELNLIELPCELGLGQLRQAGHLAMHTDKRQNWMSLGGMRIDGLISHAFLSRYAWTIDFAKREYVFRDPGASAPGY